MSDDPNEQMKTFIVIVRVMLVAAVLLASVTWTTSYLAAVSASDQKCAGLEWLQGYRNRIPEFLGLPFFGAVVVVVMGASALGPNKKLEDLFKVYNVVVLQSMQVTLGMVMAYSSLFGMLGSLGLVTSISFARYRAIAGYCLSTTAIN